jgi:hypothetical protein
MSVQIVVLVSKPQVLNMKEALPKWADAHYLQERLDAGQPQRDLGHRGDDAGDRDQ